MTELTERIGLVVDRLDNCVSSLEMNLIPTKIQFEALKEVLPDIEKELKNIFFDMGGDKDTWGD